jgi:Ca-activated chloride channel family protein
MMQSHALAHPLILSTLLALPLLSVLAWVGRRRRRQRLGRLGDRLAVQSLIAEGGRWRWLRVFCFTLAMTSLGIASAGPQWGPDWGQATAPGRDLVVVLDVSRSMFAEQPSRLSRAMAALNDLSETFKQRGGHRVALVLYASQAKSVCPLTRDYDHFRETVEGLDLTQPPADLLPTTAAISGTRIGLGLREAVLAHDPDPRQRGFQDILLISDGDDPVPDGEWRLGLFEAQDHAIPVHTVGVGDPETFSPIPYRDGRLEVDGTVVLTRLEEEPLKEIARLTGGVYLPAHTKALPLGKLLQDQLAQRPLREYSADALPQLRQRYPWFFAAALLGFTMELLLAGRLRTKKAESDEVGPAPEVS